MWFEDAMQKTALRKHQLNADLHIHALETLATPEIPAQDAPEDAQERHLKEVIGAAILKGLDIIGIVSHYSFNPGLQCKNIIAQNNYDIICLSGVETVSEEGINTIVFDAKTLPQGNEPFEHICHRTHIEKGAVLAIQPSRRNMKKLNTIVNTSSAPDFIEIFNDTTQGGYFKAFVDTGPAPDYQLTMDSAARNARDLQESAMMTRIPRKHLVDCGILQEDTGVNYVPPYVNHDPLRGEW